MTISARRLLIALGIAGVGAAGVFALGGESPVATAEASGVPKHLTGLRDTPSASPALSAIPDAVKANLPQAIAKPLRVSPAAKGKTATAQAFADASQICLSIRLANGTGGTACGPRAGIDSTELAAPVVIKDGDKYVVAGLVPDGAASIKVSGGGSEVKAPVTSNVFVTSVDEKPTGVDTVNAAGGSTSSASVTAP